MTNLLRIHREIKHLRTRTYLAHCYFGGQEQAGVNQRVGPFGDAQVVIVQCNYWI